MLDNQKKILAGGPTTPTTTTRIIKIPATSRSYGAVVNTPPPVGSAPATTPGPVIVTYSGAQPTTGPPLLTQTNGSTNTVVAAEKET